MLFNKRNETKLQRRMKNTLPFRLKLVFKHLFQDFSFYCTVHTVQWDYQDIYDEKYYHNKLKRYIRRTKLSSFLN